MLINLDAWKDEDELETCLDSVPEGAPVGERKGVKRNIVRFTLEVDDSLMQIRNESFYNATKRHRSFYIKINYRNQIKATIQMH